MAPRVRAFRIAFVLTAIGIGIAAASVTSQIWLLLVPSVLAAALAFLAYRYAVAAEGGLLALAIASRSGLYSAESFSLSTQRDKKDEALRLAAERGYRLDGDWRHLTVLGRTAIEGRFVTVPAGSDHVTFADAD
jgi:hypothetical protein